MSEKRPSTENMAVTDASDTLHTESTATDANDSLLVENISTTSKDTLAERNPKSHVGMDSKSLQELR